MWKASAIFSAVSTASDPELVKKTMVEIARSQSGDATGELEGLGVAELERGAEVEGRRLLLDRGDDRRADVAGVAAPESGGAVQNAASGGVDVMHVLGRREQAGTPLEGTVGGIGHPERVEVVGLRKGRGMGHARLLRS